MMDNSISKPELTEVNKLLTKFTEQNKSFETDNRKHWRQIIINRSWVKGQPLSKHIAHDETMDEEEGQKILTNIIWSTIQGLMPHYYSKQPDISASPSRKVNPVDGDEDEDPLYAQNKALGETLEIVTQHNMKHAGIKTLGKRGVRSGLVSRCGILKVGYQSLTNQDPLLRDKIKTQEDDIERLSLLLDSFEEGSVEREKAEADKIQFDNLLEGMQDESNRIIAEGIVLDSIPIEFMRWDMAYGVEEMRNGDWMSHYTPMPIMEAKALAGLADTEDDLKRINSWTCFPRSQESDSQNTLVEVHENNTNKGDNSTDDMVRVWERWDKLNNSVYVWVEGDYDFVRDVIHPQAIRGSWYPFFPFSPYPMDGSNWPTSVVEMLISLQLEYDDVRKQLKEHRRAALPFTIFDSTLVDAQEIQKDFKSIGARDFVGINGHGDLSKVFHSGPSVRLDARTYDSTVIQNDFQYQSGLSDAARAGIMRAKTATEADIASEEQGTRTGEIVDTIEDWQTAIYNHAAGLCALEMTVDEVKRIAGRFAVWPESKEGKQDLINGFDILIRAGSTGRPNQNKEKKQWFENLPSLMDLIMRVEQKRELGVPDVDNPYYRIIEMTMKVLDQFDDVQTILPKQRESVIDKIVMEIGGLIQQQMPGVNPAEIIQQFLPATGEYLAKKNQQNEGQ
jgi:hypothetical protein